MFIPNIINTTLHDPNLPTASDFESRIRKLLEHHQRHGNWKVKDINLEQDKKDWKALTPDQKEVMLYVLSQFLHGEENVERDIQPVRDLRENQGKFIEVKFLDTFIYDEAKHVEFFNRYLKEVIDDESINWSQFRLKNYQKFFDKILPDAMNRLKIDPSDEAVCIALTTYNLIAEGVIAETAYRGILDVFRGKKNEETLPGLCKALDYLKKDEARHIAYGVISLNNMYLLNPSGTKKKVLYTILKLVPTTLGIVNEIFNLKKPFPFDLDRNKFISLAFKSCFMRLKAVFNTKSKKVASDNT